MSNILEELLLDYGLAKAMEEALEDEEFDIESAKKNINKEISQCKPI